MVIYKNVYHTLYSISKVTRFKRTWKGLLVYGKITAEYIFDPGIDKCDTETVDHILIPSYFSDMKGIAQRLNAMIYQ